MLAIQRDLLFYEWNDFSVMSADESYAYLISVITAVLDRHAPVKRVKNL